MHYVLQFVFDGTQYSAGIDQSYDQVVNVCHDVRPVHKHKKLDSKKSPLFFFPGTFSTGCGVLCVKILGYMQIIQFAWVCEMYTISIIPLLVDSGLV